MKTFLTLLLAIVPLVSFAQPIIRNPITTNRFMLNAPSNLQVPAWNTAAGRWSNSTVSAGSDAGGTNSRQGGTLAGTNLVNNPNVVTNILGAGAVTVTSNNAGTFTITGTGGGTNTLIQTNGVNLGSAGTVNFSPGVTGYLAGAVANLGVNVAGGAGGDQIWENDAGTIQTLAYGTNIMFNPSLASSPIPLAAFLFNATNFGGVEEAGLLALQNNGTNNFLVLADGETWIGSDLEVKFSLSADSKLVVAENLERIPDGDFQDIYFGSFNDTALKEWAFNFRTATNQIVFSLLANENNVTVFEPTGVPEGTAYYFATTEGHTTGPLAEFYNLDLNHFSVAATNGITTPQISAYGATSQPWQFGDLVTGGAQVSVNGVLATLSTNVTTLITTVTTNHITFGATNAPPASAVAPTKWVSVLINGEATQYKIPLYQ